VYPVSSILPVPETEVTKPLQTYILVLSAQLAGAPFPVLPAKLALSAHDKHLLSAVFKK